MFAPTDTLRCCSLGCQQLSLWSLQHLLALGRKFAHNEKGWMAIDRVSAARLED